MSDLYQCYDCKGVTEDPDCRFEHEPYEFWGERGNRTYTLYICSHCGSDDMEEYEEPEAEFDDDECTV